MAEIIDLKPKQRLAVSALLTEKSITRAAEKAGIGERTLYRWMTQAQFRTALLTEEDKVIDSTVRRLLSMADLAVSTLEMLLAEGGVAHGVKLRAAQTALDTMLKLRELRDIENRLAALEEAVFERSEP